VSFEVYKTCCLCFFDEFSIHVFVTCNERNIHQRTGSRLYCAFEEFALIQEIIEDLGFLDVSSLHFLQSAHSFEPFEDFAAYIDAVSVRCVVQGTCICMCLICKHGWCSRKDILCDEVFADDDDYHTCRSDIFLDTTVDDAVFGYIYRLR